MFFAVCYFILRTVLRIGPNNDRREREAEILVLRHQLAVLRRTNPQPKLRRRDRIVIAGLSGLIPKARWTGFIIAPATILRWHQDLVREGVGNSRSAP
jgi:putative transposase